MSRTQTPLLIDIKVFFRKLDCFLFFIGQSKGSPTPYSSNFTFGLIGINGGGIYMYVFNFY